MSIDRFLKKASDVPTQVGIDMCFILWAVARGISRESLNDPLLDLALKKAGVNVLPNRYLFCFISFFYYFLTTLLLLFLSYALFFFSCC